MQTQAQIKKPITLSPASLRLQSFLRFNLLSQLGGVLLAHGSVGP
jgi:hypothetical protein